MATRQEEPLRPAKIKLLPSMSPLARTRTAIEFVLLLIGIPTALVAFLALLPQAWEATHLRAAQYATLSGLHAGYTLEKFRSELGEPTLVEANGGLTQYTFLGEEFAVTASASETGAVVTFGVLACNPGFKPTFLTPGTTTIILNAAPLSSAETLTSENGGRPVGTGQQDSPERVVEIARFYQPNVTGGSDNLVIEPGLNSERGSTGAPYALGVSEACGADTVYASINDLDADYKPTLSAAPSIRAYRDRVPANFYTESIAGTMESVDYGACFRTYEATADCARPVVGRVDLPRAFRAHLDLPWWRNLWSPS